MYPKVDHVLSKAKQWHTEMLKLQDIILDCGLNEELKWGQACYTLNKKNVVLIHGFKEYCALLFFKGALLHDSKGILIQQTPNVQSARQMRFTNLKEIVKLAPTIKAYVHEAVAVEKAGLKVKLKQISEYPVPEEFKVKLQKSRALKKAFEALTPGRQRGYLFHFGQAKQTKTREARIEKCLPDIMEGRGLNE